MLILGIDIGGTQLKSDCYNEEGISQGYFSEVATKVDINKGSNQIALQVCQLVESYLNSGIALSGVSISSAGVIDSERGEVVFSGPTIPNYAGTNFKTLIEERFSLPTSVENDVNCALLGEYWLGAGRGAHSLVMITIGTGIGGGILLNGQLLTGYQHRAGEVGYIPLRNGYWQDEASTTALVRRYESQKGLPHQSGKDVFEAYDKGDVETQGILDEFIENICQGLLPLIYVTNPQSVVIGGGILARQDVLLPKITACLKERIVDASFLPETLCSAALGNEAGRLGAVYHFLNSHPSIR